MQKYILGARLTYQDRGIQVLAGPTAMRRAFDADGKVVGEWQDCNAMTVVDATEHDAALAAKDRDLADANHALLLANNSADAFRRVAEQRQGEIDRLSRRPRSYQTHVFIDCEFNGYRGELISMALASQCGREFYMAMMPTQIIDPWVKENVIPVLNTEPCEQAEFTAALECYLNSFDAIQLFADWPEDIKYFFECLIVGPGQKMNTPPIAAHVRDWMHSRDSVLPHNALSDCRAIRDVYAKKIGFTSVSVYDRHILKPTTGASNG